MEWRLATFRAVISATGADTSRGQEASDERSL